VHGSLTACILVRIVLPPLFPLSPFPMLFIFSDSFLNMTNLLISGSSVENEQIVVTVALTQRNLAVLEERFWAISTPSNPSYGITPLSFSLSFHIFFVLLHFFSYLISPQRIAHIPLVTPHTTFLLESGYPAIFYLTLLIYHKRR
jgi:hypothetical protein